MANLYGLWGNIAKIVSCLAAMLRSVLKQIPTRESNALKMTGMKHGMINKNRIANTKLVADLIHNGNPLAFPSVSKLMLRSTLGKMAVPKVR